MRKRWTALLLALSMLVCAGCGGGDDQQVTEPPLPKPDIEVIRSDPAPEEVPEEPEEVPEEPEAELLAWTTDPVLEQGEMPGSYYGLELPVRGATGYTSVELPLWEAPEDYMTAQAAVAEWEAQQAAEPEPEPDPEPVPEGEAGPVGEPVLPEGSEETSDSGISTSLDVANFALKAPEEGESPAPETADGDAGDAPADSGDAEAGDVPPGTEPPADPGDGLPAVPEDGSPGESGDEPPVVSGEEPPAGPGEPGEEPSGPAQPPEGEPTESQLPEETAQEGDPSAVPAESVAPDVPEEAAPPPTAMDGALALLPPGTPMTVLDESDQWWKVRCTAPCFTEDGGVEECEVTGWVEHRYCLINLPDVVPSIIYNATNGYSSRFISCGKNIDGITGEQLYTGKTFNRRFGEEEFMMPVLYSMSFLLCKAQQSALAEGNSLILYEGYRPLETQLKVASGLRALMRVDKEVQTAITTKPWSIPWFIATSASNHQWGYAVDMSLARVKEVDVRQTGEYTYTRVIDYEEYTMPTPIHELSPAAATFTAAIGPNSATAWKSAKYTATMDANEPAKGMHRYCTEAGLSPLASEWWHFNDLASRASVLNNLSGGGFEITECLSEGPYRNVQ